jgi:hypothetical protein
MGRSEFQANDKSSNDGKMNYIKNNSVGIDFYIQRHQSNLYDKLKSLFNLSDSDIDIFGRVYRNQNDDGYTPEAFDINTQEYRDVYWDDSKSALAFYLMKGIRNISGMMVTSDVSMIFMGNIAKLIPGTQRNDEELRIAIQKLCLYTAFGFEMIGFTTDPNEVFKEFSGAKTVTGMRFKDLQPYHFFRINFSINYPVYTFNN